MKTDYFRTNIHDLLNFILHFLYYFLLELHEYQWALRIPTTSTWSLPCWDTQSIGIPSPVPIDVGDFGLEGIIILRRIEGFGLPSISEPGTGHGIPDAASPVQSRGGQSPPSNCWQHFLMHPRIHHYTPLVFLAIRAHCSFVTNMLLSGHLSPSPQSFSLAGQLIACCQLGTST